MRLLACISILCCCSLFAQKNTLSGYITDANSGEVLIGANIFEIETLEGTAANNYGFYSLTLPASDSVTIVFSYVGYTPVEMRIPFNENQSLNLELEGANALEEVAITASNVEQIQEKTEMSTVSISAVTMKKLPRFGGEVDVLKAMQLMPGIQSGNEGTSGLYVRGGSPDQNLILLDGVPVYNASHLLGFFSVFNADAINNVKLIKGGFPARYGGRLSSVMEVQMKEGNKKELHGSGSVGLIATKLTLEGPLVKDKSSFMISGRRTYLDLFTVPLSNAASDGAGSGGYFFHDLNGKINYKLSDKDKLFFSTYMGKDKFYIKTKDEFNNTVEKTSGGLDWGNITAVLRWNHQFSPKLFANVTSNYSKYQFNTGFDTESNRNGETASSTFNFFSGIEDVSGKIDFDYLPSPNHFIRFGANSTYHTFKPGAFQLLDTTDVVQLDTTIGNVNFNAVESMIYIEDDWKIGSRLKANIGLHASNFTGDSTNYFSIQPRISARFLVSPSLSIKASYAQMAQYIHLLTNTGIGLPTDLWVPSTATVAPQQSEQIALGIAKNFDGKYELSVEGYYKTMTNVIAYKDGQSFLSGSGDWQTKVDQGIGKAYGLEFLIEKKTGPFTGWIGYTLAKTDRTFTEINFGNTFPYKYDRRHDISVVAIYELAKNIDISATWVYGTGSAVTLANTEITNYNAPFTDVIFQGERFENVNHVPFIEARNNHRLSDYHRMDVSISFTKQKKWGERMWDISVYNAYNRKNPFYIAEDFENDQRRYVEYSLFPIIPSVSYNFTF